MTLSSEVSVFTLVVELSMYLCRSLVDLRWLVLIYGFFPLLRPEFTAKYKIGLMITGIWQLQLFICVVCQTTSSPFLIYNHVTARSACGVRVLLLFPSSSFFTRHNKSRFALSAWGVQYNFVLNILSNCKIRMCNK
jgi:hypothetical protein